MSLRLLVVLTFLFAFSVDYVNAQEGIPCDSLKASVSCETAPIICDLTCLDGFSARMTDTLSVSDSLRGTLCPSLGGQPSNMSWFAFVAGSTTIELRVLLNNCVPGSQADVGVQSAIYSTCELPTDGDIKQSDVLDCHAPMTPSVNDFILFSDQFIIGQVYYFFIDGFASTVCDYEIDVIQGDQPFPLEELNTLVSSDSIPADTVCLGYRNYLLRPDAGQLDIDYYWKISPSNPDYPDTFRLLEYATFWNFNFPGQYKVEVYATNGCDKTDTLEQNIMVIPLEREVFDSIDICWNDFPFDGPLTEDPNGDGVFGWLGPLIQYPGGLDTFEVVIANSGCTYIQEVYTQEIPPNSREIVTIFSCGPFDYHGNLISDNVSGLNLTLDGLSSEGCDSIVTLNATIVNLEGEIQIIDCDNGGLKIGFTTTNISAPSGYTLGYQWSDTDGPLLDDDAVPDDIIITKREFYGLEITMYFGGDSCTFDIPAKLIDPDDTKPQITAVDWTLNICDDDNIGTYTVTSDQPIKQVQWTIPAGAIYITGDANSETIEVDFTNSGSGDITVEVENFCSGKSELSFPVEIVQSPSANFTIPSETCNERELLLLALGSTNPNFQYVWNLPNQAIITSGALNTRGPITVEFNGSEGSYPIQLIIANGQCIDTLTRTIEILPNIEDLNIECSQTANSITFTWDTEDCAESYTILQNGAEIETITNTSYTFDNLAINATIDIEIEVNSTCLCPGSITPASCTTLECNGVSLSISPSEDFLCSDAWISDLPMYITINGGNGSGSYTWSGPHVSDIGFFDAVSAGAGVHDIFLTYEEDGCKYDAITTITLLDNPEVDLEIFDPQCIDDLFGGLNILATGGNGSYTYFLDEEEVNQNVDNIDIGDHTIRIVDGNTCQVIKTFNIKPTPEITYDIEGETEIYETDIMNVALNYTMSEVSLIDSISWYINGELHCSSLDCAKAMLSNLEPGEYEHNIFIYYNDCVIEESYLVLVKETSKVYLPQIFSPNNDGVNDYWFIATNDPTLIVDNVSIYNRWGNKVFSKENFSPFAEQQLWNGTFNNQAVQVGVYVLVIEYVDEFGVDQVIKKDITIVK